MTKPLFAKLRELEKKATPGPWEHYGEYGLEYQDGIRRSETKDAIIRSTIEYEQSGFSNTADAVFVAELRNALPTIFAVLDLYEQTIQYYSIVECIDCGYVDLNHEAESALKRAKEISGE